MVFVFYTLVKNAQPKNGEYVQISAEKCGKQRYLIGVASGQRCQKEGHLRLAQVETLAVP